MTSSINPTLRDESEAGKFAELLRPLGPDVAFRVARAMWDKLSIVEQAAIAADWSFWARSKQLAPAHDWRTWGFLTGRGFGKTIAISKHINDEVQAGRATLIGLAAQDEQSAVDLQINGPSGLIATAPPWFRPVWEASALQLVWPNGARAYVRTPEVPGKIRGLEYHLSWIAELQSWPNSTREEAFDNFFLSTRLGYGRIVWDATPKKRHPLLKGLLAQAESDPVSHIVVRGTTYENAANLGKGFVAEIEKKFGGTRRGQEELLGQMLDDSESATAKQAWIDDARRGLPSIFARKVVSVDPAASDRKGSDTTGLVLCGLGTDSQGYVLADASGRMNATQMGNTVLDWYVREQCDLVIAETNKIGQYVVGTLREIAKSRGLEVIVVGKEERPYRVAGKVFVKEVFARGAKQERAEPIGVAYERRRISHVIGADLASLEDTLTTWEAKPHEDSPGDLDALVHAMVDLLDLSKNTPDAKKDFVGVIEAQKQLNVPAHQQNASILSKYFPSGRGDRL